MHSQSSGPLAGFRIVELAANLTGPAATAMLADQGADVIKVEHGAGDQMRYATGYRVQGLSAVFLTANRNKRSVLVDLKDPEGLAAVGQLIASADVVVQNYRPGVIDRLGLGYAAARALREDIIYVSISGMGASGPECGRRVYDTVIQGIACMAATQRDAETGEPRLFQTAAADKITALTVAQAVTAALLARTQTGKGQHVEVSMLKACLAFMWADSMGNDTLIGEGATRTGTAVDAKLIYKTKDDYLLAAALANAEWAGLVRAVGREDLLTDPRFATMPDRIARPKEIHLELKDAFLARTTAEWVPILREADAVFAPINRTDNVHLDPQVIANGAIGEHEHPIAGRYRQPAHAIDFGQTPAMIHRHAPQLGEHTREVFAELGLAVPKGASGSPASGSPKGAAA